MNVLPIWPCSYTPPQDDQSVRKSELEKITIKAKKVISSGKVDQLVHNLITGNLYEQLSLFEQPANDINIFKSFFDFLGDCSPDSQGKVTSSLPITIAEWQMNMHHFVDASVSGVFNPDTFCTLTGIDRQDFISAQVKFNVEDPTADIDDPQVILTISRYVGEPF